jgi:hypothetical protein
MQQLKLDFFYDKIEQGDTPPSKHKKINIYGIEGGVFIAFV